MTTDELLKALAPYGVELSYTVLTPRGGVMDKVVPAKWRVLLMDWEFFTVYGDTPHEVLQIAWDAVRGERGEG
jgi:hypothetical protein